MVAIAITQAQRRLLVFAAIGFFVTSVYLCTTRLFAMSFSRQTAPAYRPANAGSYDESSSGSAPNNRPAVDISQMYVGEIELSKADLPMSYGHFKRPAYDNIRLIGSLPKEYVPTLKNGRRLIVFGDIHGTIEPFNALLEKADYDETRDHVVTVGDMVNKGPNSAAVVARLMELKASAVRGNHEDRAIVAAAAQGLQRGIESDLANVESEKHRGEHEALVTARSLTQTQRDWLASLPVILTVEPLSLYIVHAGLVPGVPLASQDPWTVMHMRNLAYPRAEFRKKEEEKRKKEEEKKKKEEEEKKEEEKKKKTETEKNKTEEEKKQEEEAKRLEAEKKAEEEKKKKEEEVKKAEEDKKKKEEEDRKKQGEATIKAHVPITRRNADRDDGEIIVSHAEHDHDILLPIEDTDKGDPWTTVWSSAQKVLPAANRRTVIYGHDSKRGYQETAYTFGLDSSCESGKSLTALIIEALEEGGFKHFVVEVPCKKD